MDKLLSGFEIYLKDIQFLSPKVNQGLQLLFIIDGTIMIEKESRYYQLQEQDVLLINRNELYKIKGESTNCVLMLNISDKFISQYYPEYHQYRFEFFSQNVDMGREKMVDHIRKMLIKLMISYYRKDESYRIEIQSYLCEILLILIRGFKMKGSAIEKLDTDDLRLTKVIEYMEQNYSQIITLEDMAKISFLSTGYLSRYFKKKMGMGISRFLMNIRLKHSLKELIYTNNTISQISINNGFPNTKSFTSLFKEMYGVTPLVYREQHGNESSKIESFQKYLIEDAETSINIKGVVTKLSMMLNTFDQSFNNTESHFEELIIDISKPINTKIPRLKHTLIIRELKELLKEDVRTQMLMVKEELGLDFVGISNLLRGETITKDVETDEAIATSSPYFKADSALNFMMKNGLSLFVKIDYQEITENEENYFEKLHSFIKHCIQVYGPIYVSSWHFLFYEPYYTAVDGEELKRVYLKLYDVLKSKLPNIHVGIFLPFSIRDKRTSNSHTGLLSEVNAIDFIGYHSNQNDIVDFHNLDDEKFYTSKDYLKENTLQVKSYLRKYAIDKPLHLISWNTLSGSTRFTNGTFFRAALVLKNVIDIGEEVDSLGFWINTALHETDGQNRKIRTEGLELFHYLNGKRPAYFSMRFVRKLSGNIISQGTDYVMTENERGYQLILMNCKIVNPFYSIEESFLQKLNKEVLVKINGLVEGEYQIRKFIFDRDHGALYKKWWSLNSKHGLDIEIIDYINRTSHPELEIFDETINGEWSFYSYLSVNAIHFYEIRKAIL